MISSTKVLKSLPKTHFHKNLCFQDESNVFHKFVPLHNFWPNDNLDVIIFLWVFLKNHSNHCQKPFFQQNLRFQTKSNVFHKFVLLDNSWPNDNLRVSIFLRFFLQNCLNDYQKPFFTKTYVFRPKPTFSTSLYSYIVFYQIIILM